MLLSDFVIEIKRKGQMGDITVTNDTVTADIIRFLVNRLYEAWREYNWDFGWTSFTFNTIANQTDYNIDGIGDIYRMTAGLGGVLKPASLEEYYNWLQNWTTDPITGQPLTPAPGSLSRYVKLGRDSANGFTVRLWMTPASVQTINGFGKKTLTLPTVAGIAAAASVSTYFPPETHDIFVEGVLADMYEVNGEDPHASEKEGLFKAKMKILRQTMTVHADDSLDVPVPDRVKFWHRRRGGSSVV